MARRFPFWLVPVILLGLVLGGCGGVGGPDLDPDPDLDPTAWTITVRQSSPVPDPDYWVYIIDRTPLLDWADITDAATYEVQIAPEYSDVNVPSVTGTTPIIECSASSYQVTSPYPWESDWFWRVRAIKADGTTSVWSMPFQFSVAQDTVIVPFPSDGGHTEDTTPALDWNDIAGAVSYDLKLCTDAGGSVVSFTVSDLVTSAYELTAGQALTTPGTTRYWFIRGRNDDGEYGLWSTSFDLTLTSAETPVGNLRDNVNTLDTTPLLSWNAIAGATGYDIYLSSDPLTVWSATPAFMSGESSTTCTLSPMTFGTHVAWGIKARVGSDPAFYPTSAIMEFSVASAYHPLGAPNGVSGTQPNLWWSPMVGAANYDVEVALDVLFHSVVQTDNVLSPLEPVDTPVTYGNSRYWRIRARSDMGDTTSWSPAFCFTVAWSQQTINATYPSTGLTIFDQTPEFDWTNVNDRDKWELWITDILPFESKFSGKYITPSADSELQLASALAMEKTWYWRVRPLNPDGVAGMWSTAFSFTTSADFIPTPASPAPSANQTPTVTWSSVPAAVSYWIQYANSEAGVATATMVDKGTATSHPFSTIPIGSSRYWRVLARNDNNTASPWSAISTVSVTWTYADPTPISPSHKEEITVTKPTLDWAAITNAISYQLQFNAGSAPDDDSPKIDCPSHSFAVPTNLADGQYYWRVRAVNGEGFAGPWTSTWDFTVK